jgi:tRNA modification GTPase
VTLVMNKSDQVTPAAASRPASAASVAILRISAATGEGIEQLREQLAAVSGHTESRGGSFSARARHVDALDRAVQHLGAAREQLAAKHGELAALDLRAAQQALGEVVGDVSSDELLGYIFGSFCIGK